MLYIYITSISFNIVQYDMLINQCSPLCFYNHIAINYSSKCKSLLSSTIFFQHCGYDRTCLCDKIQVVAVMIYKATRIIQNPDKVGGHVFYFSKQNCRWIWFICLKNKHPKYSDHYVPLTSEYIMTLIYDDEWSKLLSINDINLFRNSSYNRFFWLI